jgi:hypothetical protein
MEIAGEGYQKKGNLLIRVKRKIRCISGAFNDHYCSPAMQSGCAAKGKTGCEVEGDPTEGALLILAAKAVCSNVCQSSGRFRLMPTAKHDRSCATAGEYGSGQRCAGCPASFCEQVMQADEFIAWNKKSAVIS